MYLLCIHEILGRILQGDLELELMVIGCYLVNLAVPFEELCLIDKDGYLLGALRTY